ncbi:SH3 domain-containing protein [Rhizobium sp. F40D2]|uniref:SH3 domain-containing protein n=1 Tax=Rhizobium sp. F40D2 TaxID=3453141 RepID=UPI003F26D463
MPLRKIVLKYFMALAAIVSSHDTSVATPSPAPPSDWEARGRETGLPIPRFVSLKANRARMRVGPAFEYAVEWIYQAPGLPLEITEEYGNWRQVRDCDGISGWMHRSLLSSRRTAIVGPWLKHMAALRTQARVNGTVEAKLEPRVRVRVLSCSLSWCDVRVDKDQLRGFIDKPSLWGVYPKEIFR